MSGLTNEQVLDLYGRESWQEIQTASWPGQVIHGEKLVLLMGGKGVADNVDKARRTLKAAEALGIVARRAYRPTQQQQFFGSNSQFGSAVLNPDKTGHDEVLYEWEFLQRVKSVVDE